MQITFAKTDVEKFDLSLSRALENDAFLDAFYDNFIGAGDHVAHFFTNSDMPRQKRKLRKSLENMARLIDGVPGYSMYISHLARVHHRYNIPPELYELWLDTLIQALYQSDPEFNEECEGVWRRVMKTGIDIMMMKPGTELLDSA